MDFKTVINHLNSKKNEEVVEGLRSIINECNQLRKDKVDVASANTVLNQYLVSSPHCIELFNIWNDERGNYDRPILQALFETFAECIRYGHDNLKKELCLTILRKQTSDVMGAITSENKYSNNSVCTLLYAICNVGAAGVQLVNQKIPINTITQLPSMLTHTRTRYRSCRWIISIIRNDPEIVGKQLLLRQDIIAALADGLHHDGEVLMKDIVNLFSDFILNNSYCSAKLKQSFFSSTTLSHYISFCQKDSCPVYFKQFVLKLFGNSNLVLYPPLTQFTSTTFLPSTLYKIALSLNPFKFPFDKTLYLLIIQEHPEIIPALFNEPTKQVSSVESYLNVNALEQAKSKVLINWMLEPRDSSLWEKTIDFLVEILNTPVVLPKDLIGMAFKNHELFLTSIHSWLYPGVLTRSTLSKGLSTTNSMMILKTLELIEAISNRLSRIAVQVYGSLDKAAAFLNHYYPILPLEDSFSQLFKKCCMCLLQNTPFSGKVVEKPKEDTSAPLVNMIMNEMEVEEGEEEVASNREVPQLLYQLTVAINSLFSLFVKEMGMFRIDVISLFSLLNDTPLLFTLEEECVVVVLQLLAKISKINPSFTAQFIAGKNTIKPLLAIIQAYPSASNRIQAEIHNLLLIVFEESQAFASFTQPSATLSLLLSILTPSLACYLNDVLVDLRSQRIRFLTRNNQLHLQTPLLFHAFLYSALKPKAVNTLVNLFMSTQVLLLTQPQCMHAVLELTKKYIEEAMLSEEDKNKLGNDKLLAGQMTDDMLQMLRRLVQEWSADFEPMKLKITVGFDFTSLEKEYTKDIDTCLMTVFHTFLWHCVRLEDLRVLAQNERLVPLLLLSSQTIEDQTIKQSREWVIQSISRIPTGCSVLLDYSSVHMNGVLPSQPSSPPHVSSLLYLFLHHTLVNNDFTQLDSLKQFVQHCSLQDIEMVLESICLYMDSFFLREETLQFVLTLLSHLISFGEAGNQDIRRKMIDLLIQQNAQNSGYYLTYLASSLYTEEKMKLIQSILSSSSIQYSLLQPFTLPLDHALLESLINASIKEEYYIQLLLLNLVHTHEPDLNQLVTADHLSAYIQQIKNPVYKQFIQFLIKGYACLHTRFWTVVFSPVHDGALYEFFEFFTSLIVLSLSHPGIHQSEDESSILQILHESTFFNDLVNKLSSTQLSVYLECFQLLTKYPAFSSSVQIDLVSICKQSFKKEAISKQRFNSLLLLCKQDQNEKAVGILVLRSIQELAKRWGKNGESTEELNEFVDVLTDLLVDEPSILVLLLKKQNELLMKFCRLLLRERLEDWRSLKLLRVLIEASYAANIMIENVNNINILELVTTHSSYPTILNRIRDECVCSNDDELRKKWMSYSPSQFYFSVEFFLFVKVMVQYNPFYCSQSFFFQLLSFYNCSFSPSDRILREIFRTLHRANRFSLEDVGYLFGRFAPASASENIQTPSTWLLEAVSGLRLRKSIEDFPREKGSDMEVEESENEEEKEDEEDIVNDKDDEDEEKRIELEGYRGYEDEESESENKRVENVFDVNMDCIEKLLSDEIDLEVSSQDCILIVDPSVYLPLIYYYLNLSTVDTRAYISHGVAGYILACMSSSNPVIRQCASCILQRFYEIIQDSSFFEQKQVNLAFRKLQNSIDTPSIQLSSIVVSFFNESLGILLRPGNPLYNYISRFFLSFPSFNLEDIPLFHQLFLNENEDYKQLRAWCLRFILRGTQSYQDFVVLNRRHVVSQVQAFATSSNADLYTQKCCLGIVYRLSTIPLVVPMLFRSTGLFPWLMMVLRSAKSRVIVYCVVDMLGNMMEVLNQTGSETMLIQVLVLLKQLLELLKETTEEGELADFNKLLLKSVKYYAMLIRGVEKTYDNSIQKLFFEVWKLILARMKCYKNHKTPEGTSLLIADCVLSNDDFFLLCTPQLVSYEEGYEEARKLLKEIHPVLPFSAALFAEVEGEYDQLFI